MSKIVVVNEKDEVLRFKDRDDHNVSDIIRVSALMIFNSAAEVLMAQRSFTKVRSPGKWGPAVAGTIEEGETYESNILKEAEEELELSIMSDDIVIGPKNLIKNTQSYFIQTFFMESNEPAEYFKPRVGEVEKVEWIPLDKLTQWIGEKPEDFTPAANNYLSDITSFLKGKGLV